LQEPGMRIGAGAMTQKRHRLAALFDQFER